MRAFVTAIVFALAALTGAFAPSAAQTADGGTNSSYHLGVGDKIHVNVYGQTDLSGDFDVDSTGVVQLPLVGPVKALGLTPHEFEVAIANALKAGEYLKDPRVSVQVTTYRPFYIIGEVNKPGEYAYVNDMNVLNAVALAGGFTFRADDSVVYIRRNGSKDEIKMPVDQSTRIQPGDIVRIGERFF